MKKGFSSLKIARLNLTVFVINKIKNLLNLHASGDKCNLTNTN